ncbi:DUF2945 domain-containing protein [Variovorax sp. J22P168]|uniref:DUF2945 domain-containing protein n=1 Tax=Variovorax jilinensis TaxID=3053513 RepID=UPI00257821C5|nr:DUF2945 domain-containing protein [Variovorax sp. J22P168]MDM0014542.1 DUF2945 domain-containing protein [Variovorax sp. J22P168]
MKSKPKVGEKVEWETSQGMTTGKVVREVKGTVRIKGHTAKASRAEPQFEVESSKSGKRAIHKAEALRRSG